MGAPGDIGQVMLDGRGRLAATVKFFEVRLYGSVTIEGATALSGPSTR